jgi:hypothetical protein
MLKKYDKQLPALVKNLKLRGEGTVVAIFQIHVARKLQPL